MLAWGDANYGGLIPSSVDPKFIIEIVANNVGFSAIKSTNKIVTWGNFPAEYLPSRIADVTGTLNVRQIVIVEI